MIISPMAGETSQSIVSIDCFEFLRILNPERATQISGHSSIHAIDQNVHGSAIRESNCGFAFGLNGLNLIRTQAHASRRIIVDAHFEFDGIERLNQNFRRFRDSWSGARRWSRRCGR